MPRHRIRRVVLLSSAAVAMLCSPPPGWGWTSGHPFNIDGCHEPLTAEVLETVRSTLATAPAITPTRDEAAMFEDIQFRPPENTRQDVAAMSLILGVRDNDNKGENVLSSLDVTEVHGNPSHQDEHCLRTAANDGSEGDRDALAACRSYIVATATAALDGLDGGGVVDANVRIPLKVYLNIAGQESPELPLFYVRIGQALHALQDSFSHTYRTADGMQVTAVLNWIDLVEENLDEERDGPPHLSALDRCASDEPVVVRNLDLARQASIELLTAALDSSRTREQKVAAFEAVVARYLSYAEGCTFADAWCDAVEAQLPEPSTCGCGIGDTTSGGLAIGAAAAYALFFSRRRRGVAIALLLLLSPLAARADDTPTAKEIAEVRKDKRLGPRLGVALSLGGSFHEPAAVGRIGARFRLSEEWLVGLDGEWNPWITSTPMRVRSGSLNFAGVLIRRFPMRWDRVNLRTSIRAGVSTLLFDVYGAQKGSTGPFVGVSVLGLDIDLGSSVRIVFEPSEISVPLPLVSPLPLYYEQFRFMIGVQVGS